MKTYGPESILSHGPINKIYLKDLESALHNASCKRFLKLNNKSW